MSASNKNDTKNKPCSAYPLILSERREHFQMMSLLFRMREETAGLDRTSNNKKIYNGGRMEEGLFLGPDLSPSDPDVS